MAGCTATPGNSDGSRVDPTFNEIRVDTVGVIRWNGARVSAAELEAILKRSVALPIEPELRLTPSPNLDYATFDKVMTAARNAGVSKMGFVGNEAYAPGEASPE